MNLGKLRADENALWSLGAHDVSVVLHLIGEEPGECVAHGASYVREGVEDVVFCYLRFPSGHRRAPAPLLARPAQGAAHHGRRRASAWRPSTTCCSRASSTLYDKGFDEDARSWGEYIARSGDIFSPRLANAEPLRVECEHFVECVRTGTHAALGRRERAARGARARAPAALARRRLADRLRRGGARRRRACACRRLRPAVRDARVGRTFNTGPWRRPTPRRM